MITPKEIKNKAEKKYISFLQELVESKPFSKLVIRGDKSYNKSSLAEFEKEIQLINSQSKERKDFGYTLEFQKVKTKYLGTQDLPTSIYFDTEIDFLRFLGKEKEVELISRYVKYTIEIFPELKEWIVRNPIKVIQNQAEWEDILNVCQYFRQNPKPNLYIRELPIKVHTKFIENNKGILLDLLNIIVPIESIDHNFISAKDFEKRFGLKSNQSQIRIRMLDRSIANEYLSGLTDLEITEEEFNKLAIPCDKVFILENKTNFSNLMNFLTLPHMKNSIGIFGSGYKIRDLKNAMWLANKEIYYWGDIDTHGLQILSQMRGYFPQTKSIMMDFKTLNSFKDDWGIGESIHATTLLNLNPEEQELFLFIKADNQKTIRLEQEKISHEYVLKEIKSIYEL